jgi:RNA recognition motif-containing protein
MSSRQSIAEQLAARKQSHEDKKPKSLLPDNLRLNQNSICLTDSPTLRKTRRRGRKGKKKDRKKESPLSSIVHSDHKIDSQTLESNAESKTNSSTSPVSIPVYVPPQIHTYVTQIKGNNKEQSKPSNSTTEQLNVVQNSEQFAQQISLARQQIHHQHHNDHRHEQQQHHHHQQQQQHHHQQQQHGFSSSGLDYDPDSNVYVANLPSDYGKERLYKLFGEYGQIIRYKFVTPEEASQPGYGFVQFASRKDAHCAIKNLENYAFPSGDVIYLSIALRRRSSLSDEPTNLYVKNLPSSWSNDRLRKLFSQYGSIRQSKVVGDGIAFVRFEDHEQALNAIGNLDKLDVENGQVLEVRFATRKTAANAYRLQQVPNTSKSNEHNLYIRNLPKFYSQQHLEQLFEQFGKISSAKINENGIAFVRYTFIFLI